MLKLRLQRRGKRNYATYRVVVTEAGAPIKGRFIADVGHYNPHTNVFSVDADVVKMWLGRGVQASPTVHNLLVNHKVIDAPKVTSWRPKKKATEAAPTAAIAAPAAQAEKKA
ncbi:MAG: 30S ribosomal protein S16 [Candidatus Andersenbacteria bacterium]|nr:30S ribosomal protein S16 [Candidatus Andersenbacteria bacterium]MBI3250720.1 30S ribosomal protein S16 [Candidatus Andersenbacteria bacterium]